METTHKYFRLIQSVFFILLLSFSMSSCEKEEPVSTPPSTRQTAPPVDDLTDFELSDPIIRPDNEQTVFMYLCLLYTSHDWQGNRKERVMRSKVFLKHRQSFGKSDSRSCFHP